MHRNGNGERVEVFFKAIKWQGEIINQEPLKCDDLSWFYLDNLPENIIPFIKLALNNIQVKIFYSELGWNK